MNAVTAGEAFHEALAMDGGATGQVARDTDVERAVTLARHHVNEEELIPHDATIHDRHSREGGNPWRLPARATTVIPAFAGMTVVGRAGTTVVVVVLDDL
jgi:hypothetical protein